MRRRFEDQKGNLPGGYVSVVFDKQMSDPANITIQDSQLVLDTLLSGFRRCLCKNLGQGEVAICYLDDSNSNFYEDGTPAVLTGEEGDVMVNFPEFWYKWVGIDDTHFAYRFAFSNIDGSYKHVTRSLLGAYKAYIDGNKTCSRSGVNPTSNRTRGDFYIYASQQRKGYRIIDFQQHCVIAFMLYAKYKTRDLQSVLGVGGAIHSPATTTGSSNETGITDTSNETSKYVCGLGIEGVFGGIREWVLGVIINNRVWTITDPDGSTRNISAYVNSGWITNIAAENGPFFDMVPIKTGDIEASYYSDFYFQNSYSDRVFGRSCHDSNINGGVSYVSAQVDYSSTDSSFSSRLAFRGVINEMDDVEEFKSIQV